MPGFIKDRWLLFLVIAVLVALKAPYLHCAYHWDECWVYSPAVKTMYKKGISLLPGALAPDLSRGHPMMFHVLYAMWLNIFGTSNTSLHSFALLSSVILLIVIYEVACRLFNKRVGVLTLFLVASQVIFVAMSASVLPEVFVSLFGILCIWFYCHEKYLLTALLLTMLFFTKEISAVLGLILGVHAGIGMFSSGKPLKARVYNLLSIAVPGILILLFFIRQKMICGWYIMPDHSNTLTWNWDMFYYIFRKLVYFTFVQDYRGYLFGALLLMSVFVAIKQRRIGPMVLLLPAISVFILITPSISEQIGDVLLFALLPVTVAICIYYLMRMKYLETNMQRKFTRFIVLFFLGAIIFSSITFFTYRYLLPCVIMLMYPVAFFIDHYLERLAVRGYVVAGIAIVVFGFFAMKYDDGCGDADMAQYDAIAVHQATVDYLEQNGLYDKPISAGSFLQLAHLVRVENGFLRHNRAFSHLLWGKYISGSEYVLIDNVDGNCDTSVKQDRNYYLLYRSTSGRCWSEIYARKK